MSFKMPSTEQVRELGDSLGINVTDSYAEFRHRLHQAVCRRLSADRVAAGRRSRDQISARRVLRPEGERTSMALGLRRPDQGRKPRKTRREKVAVKDTYSLAGIPLTNGASVLEGYVPEFDAPVITRLLDAGAEIVGKSVCEYFSFSGGAATSTSGPVHNPRAWGHTPGGSSTGSGAFVALGEVDMATGGDQAGSIRIPASLSGVVGIKPTWGLFPIPVSWAWIRHRSCRAADRDGSG